MFLPNIELFDLRKIWYRTHGGEIAWVIQLLIRRPDFLIFKSKFFLAHYLILGNLLTCPSGLRKSFGQIHRLKLFGQIHCLKMVNSTCKSEQFLTSV